MQATNSPHFIRAKTAVLLQKSMLKNNLRYGLILNYQIVFNSSDKFWYAWFTIDALTVLEKAERSGD